MKNIVITGANGFIGSALSQYYVSQPINVMRWVYGDTFSFDEEMSLIQMDLRNPQHIEKALNLFAPDVIIHCAGSANVSKSVSDPYGDFTRNVGITHNLLFALHKASLNNIRFVFLSSAAVYGNPKKLPITEKAELNPLSPYAIHKVLCEELCLYFKNNYGMDVKIGRIFSAYGEGLHKQLFWDLFCKSKKNGPIELFGTGNESRDYIHISDVVQAIHLLASTDSSDVYFNIANGEELTIREVSECFVECLGIEKSRVCFNGTVREGDPLNWRADISRIEALGYRRKKTMRDGLYDYSVWVNEEDRVDQ